MHEDDRGRPADEPHPLAAVPDAVYKLDPEGRFVYVNSAAEELLERRAEDLLGRRALDCFPDARGSDLEHRFRQAFAEGRTRSFEYLWTPQDRWYEVRVIPDRGLVVVLRDIHEHRRTDKAREAEIGQLSAVLEALPSATVVVDGNFRILTANRAWVDDGAVLLRGIAGDHAVGDDYLGAMGHGLRPRDHEAISARLRRLLRDDADPGSAVFDYEYPCRTTEGTGWFHLQASRLEGPPRAVITHTDITPRVRDEQALAWQARHDDLTGLPNRAAMLELIGGALEDEGGRAIALLFLDLDGFKTVNDSLGHEVGDGLLCQVADRLVEQVRPGDAVGRLGGDQFLVLARDCESAEAAALAFRLQTTFTLPFAAEGISVPLTASIGVAVTTPGQRTAHGLLSDADAAVYAAKGTGRERVHLFSPSLREAARWRLEVATRLRDGAVDEFVVHYQPVVRLDTGAVEGVEALVRWAHPERGLLSPDAFLSVAEETGQLIPITRWLLQETTRQAAQWAAQGLSLRMAVNISARHFSAETLVRDVRLALRESGLPPEHLILELTETSVAEDPTRAEDQLTVLRGLGVRVAIDDFGTGWSSLAQLLALPIGTLKIDRSLVTAAEQVTAGGTGDVLAAIVSLTRTLGIRSVAEGVETPDHLRMVRAAGCDLAQGWLLARPMPADQIPRWVSSVQAAGGDLCALVTEGQLR